MMGLMVAGWLLAAGVAAPDTVLDLRRGERVVVEGLAGSVEVRAWDRATLSVEGEGAQDRGIAVRREGGRVVVGPDGRKARSLAVTLRVRLPSWVPLEIQGRELDVDVAGVAAELVVRTVDGDIRVSDVSGPVTVSSVEGLVEVRGVRGNVSARSRGEDVVLADVEGAVEVESGSGDLRLEDVNGPSVRAQTLDGDLFFRGALARGGSYWFSVHDGDAELVLPAGTSARATVSTFDGELVSDFPVTLQRYGGGGVFDFILGDGSARLEVGVFDGEIRLLSAGR